VGRREERDRIVAALERARDGAGSVLLLAGEAGVGKTRLADEIAAEATGLVLRGGARQGGATPYEPIAAALRTHLRIAPDALAGCGPLKRHLALLLPELGRAPAAGDRPTLFEAVRCALAHLAAERELLLVLDDLHWSDAATLELLSALAEPLSGLPVLVLAGYRADGLPRDHGIRRLRNDLRRAGRLDEVTLAPLERDETHELLEAVLDGPVSPGLVRAVHDRTEGVPFFVEELARALQTAGRLARGHRGLELAGAGKVPLPDTVRDAVLIGAAELADDARAAADVAAVAGEEFELDLVAGLAGEPALARLLASGLVVEGDGGSARFRHALARDAIYADVAWLRRRALHREVAAALEATGAPAMRVAAQWLGAREDERARAALIQAAAESEAMHAYRDAADAGRQALDLWPDGDEAGRLETLERYAASSELAGDLAEAVRGWREVADIRGSRGEGRPLADAQRRLAAAYDLKGERESAFAARRVAAEVYAARDLPGEAAVEHLAMANHLRLSGKHVAAVELARTAAAEAGAAGRDEVRIRALGLEGMARAKGGDFEPGLATVRGALAEAVERDLTAVAAELYQRLSLVLYDAADYGRAQQALDTALELCRASGAAGTEEACVTCLAYVLRDRGEWSDGAAICRDLIASGSSVFVAEGLLGSIHGFQGRISSARRLLASSLAVSSRLGHYNMTVDATAALAAVAAHEGAHEEAAEHCRALLARWSDTDDHHYALGGLRWAAAWFARRGERREAHACIEALTRIASASGHAEALAALAHGIAETALLDGDADTAASQLATAVELHRAIDMPYVRAQIELRAGVALAGTGDREGAVERIAGAYRTARKLGARPLAAEAASEMAALGESVVRRLGRTAAAEAEAGGLSRRETEVVRLLAVGRTNREIAQDLFLSPRTVDMHVRNILRKLDCRSRVEAAGRASELGLLADPPAPLPSRD